MHRHLAFLRAINVAGRRVGNAELCEPLLAAGFSDATAYQAAGNLVVEGEVEDPATVTRRIEEALAEALGFDVPTFVRTTGQARAIAAATPFPEDAVADSTAKPQVILLRTEVEEEVVAGVARLSTDADRLVVDGSEVHWLPTGGVGRSELDLDAMAALTGPVTVRTAGTIQRMVARFLD